MRILLPESFATPDFAAVCPFGAHRHAADLSSHLVKHYKEKSRSHNETCQVNIVQKIRRAISRYSVLHLRLSKWRGSDCLSSRS